MATDLAEVQTALGALSETALHALIAASNDAPQVAYGLLGWIEGVCDWELNRRAGHEYDLLPPDAAIDPNEGAVSIQAAYALRALFERSGVAPAVLRFLDEPVRLLIAEGEHKH